MEKLKYIEFNGQPVVSARDLYAFLTEKCGTNVAAWLIHCSEHSMMVEGEDFFIVSQKGSDKDVLMLPTCASVMCASFKTERARLANGLIRSLIQVEQVENFSIKSNDTSISISECAKIINYPGGVKGLFTFLRESKILMKSNIPYQNYMNGGYFKVVTNEYTVNKGRIFQSARTFVTVDGVEFIKKTMVKNKHLVAA